MLQETVKLKISLTLYVPCIMFQCVDKPTTRSTSYELSLLSIGIDIGIYLHSINLYKRCGNSHK